MKTRFSERFTSPISSARNDLITPYSNIRELLLRNSIDIDDLLAKFSPGEIKSMKDCLSTPYAGLNSDSDSDFDTDEEENSSKRATELVYWCTKLCEQCYLPELFSQVLTKALNSWQIANLDCTNKLLGLTGAQLIAQALTQEGGIPCLNGLCLGGCALTNNGVQILINAIAKNHLTKLETLSLSGNDLNHEIVSGIINLISHTPSLRVLRLRANKLGPVSQKRIKDKWEELQEKYHRKAGDLILENNSPIVLHPDHVEKYCDTVLNNLNTEYRNSRTKYPDNLAKTLQNFIKTGKLDQQDDYLIATVAHYLAKYAPDALHWLNEILRNKKISSLTLSSLTDDQVEWIAEWLRIATCPISTLSIYTSVPPPLENVVAMVQKLACNTSIRHLTLRGYENFLSPRKYATHFVKKLQNSNLNSLYITLSDVSGFEIRPWLGDDEISAFAMEKFLFQNRKISTEKTTMATTAWIMNHHYQVPHDIVNLVAQKIVSDSESAPLNSEKDYQNLQKTGNLPQDNRSILALICYLDKLNDPNKFAAFNLALQKNQITELTIPIGESFTDPLHIANWLGTNNPCVSKLKLEVFHYSGSIATALCDALKKNDQLKHLEMLFLGEHLYKASFLHAEKFIEMLQHNSTLTTLKVDKEAYFEERDTSPTKPKWREEQQIRVAGDSPDKIIELEQLLLKRN